MADRIGNRVWNLDVGQQEMEHHIFFTNLATYPELCRNMQSVKSGTTKKVAEDWKTLPNYVLAITQ
ncbi:MAG: hypothetical protein ACC707_11960 [Thiohalomonadales bacterium]